MSKNLSNLTKPEHWAEWFEKCALALCGDEAKHALGIFAHERYEQAFRRALGERKMPRNELPSEARELISSTELGACWYDLEASYWYGGRDIASGNESGNGAKAYKTFYRETAATKPTPDEARKYLEGSSTKYLILSRCRTIVSESIPRVGGRVDESGNSREDLVLENESDPASVCPLMDTQFGEDANQVFSRLTTEEKILILASMNEISLEHPEIKNRLGHKKSVLYKRQAAAREKIGNMLGVTGSMREYEGNPLDLGRVLGRLLDFLNEWADSPECGIGSCLMGGEVKP